MKSKFSEVIKNILSLKLKRFEQFHLKAKFERLRVPLQHLTLKNSIKSLHCEKCNCRVPKHSHSNYAWLLPITSKLPLAARKTCKNWFLFICTLVTSHSELLKIRSNRSEKPLCKKRTCTQKITKFCNAKAIFQLVKTILSIQLVKTSRN